MLENSTSARVHIGIRRSNLIPHTNFSIPSSRILEALTDEAITIFSSWIKKKAKVYIYVYVFTRTRNTAAHRSFRSHNSRLICEAASAKPAYVHRHIFRRAEIYACTDRDCRPTLWLYMYTGGVILGEYSRSGLKVNPVLVRLERDYSHVFPDAAGHHCGPRRLCTKHLYIRTLGSIATH